MTVLNNRRIFRQFFLEKILRAGGFITDKNPVQQMSLFSEPILKIRSRILESILERISYFGISF